MAFKTEKSPSLFGVYFFAVLMAVASAFLGFAYMMTFSPQAFSSLREYQASLGEEEAAAIPSRPADLYYIRGPVARANSWVAKREQLIAPGPQTVSFSSGEINAWFTARIQPGVPPAGADAPSLLIVPGVPNIAITAENVLYLNLSAEVEFYGRENEYTLFARGTAVDGELQLEAVYIGGAKVPLPEVLGRQLMKVVLSAYQSSEEFEIISQAFERLVSIQINEGQLTLELR